MNEHLSVGLDSIAVLDWLVCPGHKPSSFAAGPVPAAGRVRLECQARASPLHCLSFCRGINDLCRRHRGIIRLLASQLRSWYREVAFWKHRCRNPSRLTVARRPWTFSTPRLVTRASPLDSSPPHHAVKCSQHNPGAAPSPIWVQWKATAPLSGAFAAHDGRLMVARYTEPDHLCIFLLITSCCIQWPQCIMQL